MNHRKSPIFRITVILCAILALTAITVLAYLSTTTGSLVNIFKPANDPEVNINEVTTPAIKDGMITEKSDVKVNVGNPGYAVYVRAVIVVNWEKNNTEGTYHATKPVLDTDYTLNLNAIDWFEHNGFYYHKAMVAFDGHTESTKETAALINSCSQIAGTAPPGYHLDVQIIAQTIQALGTTDNDAANPNIPAVTDAWKIEVENQQLVDPNP